MRRAKGLGPHARTPSLRDMSRREKGMVHAAPTPSLRGYSPSLRVGLPHTYSPPAGICCFRFRGVNRLPSENGIRNLPVTA